MGSGANYPRARPSAIFEAIHRARGIGATCDHDAEYYAGLATLISEVAGCAEKIRLASNGLQECVWFNGWGGGSRTNDPVTGRMTGRQAAAEKKAS